MDEQNKNTNEMIGQDVVAFFTSDTFFDGLILGKADIDATKFEVTMNIFKADDFWSEQHHRLPYHIWSDLWDDATGDENVPVRNAVGHDSFDEVEQSAWYIRECVWDFMNDRLSETDDQRHPIIAEILHAFVEDISVHAMNTAIAEHFKKQGFEFPFQDLVFDALKQGGFPVNWKGTYPEGQLVVFHW